MYIAIDDGYSGVKAVSSTGKKVHFPSVVAPFTEDPTRGMFTQVEHKVRINGNKFSFVGKAAQQSSGATATLSAEKPEHIHNILIATAAYLLGANDTTPVAVGLPFGYYRAQKATVKKQIEDINMFISCNDGPEKRISFPHVEVFPQASGLLLPMIDSLPHSGYIAVVDIGYHTTEALLFELGEHGRLMPILEGCKSIEVGICNIHQAMAQIFLQKTGGILPTYMYDKTLQQVLNGQPIFYKNNTVDLVSPTKKAFQETATLIKELLVGIWGSRSEFIAKTVCVGGGVILLKQYLDFYNMYIPDNPVYANAESFLFMLKHRLQNEIVNEKVINIAAKTGAL